MRRVTLNFAITLSEFHTHAAFAAARRRASTSFAVNDERLGRRKDGHQRRKRRREDFQRAKAGHLFRDPFKVLRRDTTGDATGIMSPTARGSIGAAERVAMQKSDAKRDGHFAALMLTSKPESFRVTSGVAMPFVPAARLGDDPAADRAVLQLLAIAKRWDVLDVRDPAALRILQSFQFDEVAQRSTNSGKCQRSTFPPISSGPAATPALLSSISYTCRSSARWRCEDLDGSQDVADAVELITTKLRGPELLSLSPRSLFLLVRSIASMEMLDDVSPGLTAALTIASSEVFYAWTDPRQQLEVSRLLLHIFVLESRRRQASPSAVAPFVPHLDSALISAAGNLRAKLWSTLPERFASFCKHRRFLDALDAVYVCWCLGGGQLPADLPNPASKSRAAAKYGYLRHVLRISSRSVSDAGDDGRHPLPVRFDFEMFANSLLKLQDDDGQDARRAAVMLVADAALGFLLRVMLEAVSDLISLSCRAARDFASTAGARGLEKDRVVMLPASMIRGTSALRWLTAFLDLLLDTKSLSSGDASHHQRLLHHLFDETTTRAGGNLVGQILFELEEAIEVLPLSLAASHPAHFAEEATDSIVAGEDASCHPALRHWADALHSAKGAFVSCVTLCARVRPSNEQPHIQGAACVPPGTGALSTATASPAAVPPDAHDDFV